MFGNTGQAGLFVAASDGSDEHPLLSSADTDYDPVWAPDGSSIVFTSERDGSAELYRVKPDGSGLERLTNDPAYDDQAAFSPDGKQLGLRDHPQWRTRGSVDHGSGYAPRESPHFRNRRRLPAFLVAGRKVDRFLIGPRQRIPVQPWTVGAPSVGRYLCHSSGQLRAQENHARAETSAEVRNG